MVGLQVCGVVMFVECLDGVQVIYNLVGLLLNSDYVLQVYECGDCNVGDGLSVGQVFVLVVDWLCVGVCVVGDFGNIYVDVNGVVVGFIVVFDLVFDGVCLVMNCVVLVYCDVSDLVFVQYGVGFVLVCGVIC